MAKLLSYFPNYTANDSLFQKMVGMGAPWDISQALSMDISYFTMWSGLAMPSQFTKLNSVDNIADSQKIARVLWDIYGKNWQKLWDAFNKEYNPIENYNLSETVNRKQTDDRVIDRTGSLNSEVDGTIDGTTKETLQHGVTSDGTVNVVDDSKGTSSLLHGEQIQKDAEADSYTYGFNTTIKVPTGVQIETGTENHSGTDTTTTQSHETTDTTTHNKTDTDATTDGTYSETSNEKRVDTTTQNTTDNDNLQEDTVRERSGNVGQNSYQELLRQEFELWKWNFFEQVFSDVDKFLILRVYDPCQFS